MKKFFISVLKALGYFGIYLGAQFLVTFVYMMYSMVPAIVKYSMGNYDLTDPVIFNQYLNEATQPLLDATMLITIISGLLTIGIICVIFKCRKQKLSKSFCLRKISGGTVVSVTLLGFGLNLMFGILVLLLPESWIASYEETASAAFAGEFWQMAIAVVIMAPLVEELVFRGLIYTRLKQGMPVVVAMIITSLWFGVMHGHPLWAAYAAVLGLVMVWIFERTKSLFASMLFHFGYNSVAAIEMALPESVPDWVGIVMLAGGVVLAAIGMVWFMRLPKAENDDVYADTDIIQAEAKSCDGAEE